MLVFITGSTGLIGQRLVIDRLERGDRVLVLSRNAQRANRLFATDVNPNIRVIEGDCTFPGRWQKFIDTCDAVIHLAGAGIFDERWTDAYKRELWNSRIDSTHQVVNAIEAAVDKPRVLINASAVGFYGETGEKVIDESAPPGRDFLAELTVNWEQQAARASDSGTRAVMLRTGIVLDDRGGALDQMMMPFRFHAGGKIGSGKQWMSWIHYRDILGLVDLALRDRSLDGPINIVSPNPARNREFMQTLGEALGRSAWLRAPKFGLKIALGEFADYLTMSQRITPAKALAHGYHFLFSQLDDALRSLIAAVERRRGREETTAPSRLAYESIDVEMNGSAAVAMAMNLHRSSADGDAGAETSERRTLRPRLERPPKGVRLVAVDVDGTMLRSDGKLGQSVIDACRSAARSGCTIVPATARPPRAMQSILQTLGAPGVVGPTINYNGAVIWNPLDRKAQYHEALGIDIVREMIERARSILPHILVSVEIMDRWFTDRIDARYETETSRIFEPDFIGPIDQFLTEPITKLMFLAEPAELSPVMDMVRVEYWAKRRVAVFLTDPHIIQISHPLVDKGIALQRIAKKMNITREEVMAIGDGPNDAGMVEWSGFGVAVENACDLVRDLADVIVPSNDNLGVAKAIQRYVLGG